MVTPLKLETVKKEITITELSRQASIPRQYVSLAASGRFVLNRAEKLRIANVLDVSISQIFPENASVPA